MTDPVAELAARFDFPVLRRGPTIYVAARDGARFLKLAREASIRVLGAEGFRVTNDGIEPAMEPILDLSTVSDAQRSVEEAIGFISHFSESELWFEFNCVPAG